MKNVVKLYKALAVRTHFTALCLFTLKLPLEERILAARASVLIALLRKSESSSIPSEFTILVGREKSERKSSSGVSPTPTYTI
jgi:hypothetical protein